uniref:Uncharacterized protein n=1 Tax=Amphimedon queenslandica TaxID=400682 RepID=A0A1X7VYD7_AMPQE
MSNPCHAISEHVNIDKCIFYDIISDKEETCVIACKNAPVGSYKQINGSLDAVVSSPTPSLLEDGSGDTQGFSAALHWNIGAPIILIEPRATPHVIEYDAHTVHGNDSEFDAHTARGDDSESDAHTAHGDDSEFDSHTAPGDDSKSDVHTARGDDHTAHIEDCVSDEEETLSNDSHENNGSGANGNNAQPCYTTRHQIAPNRDPFSYY